MSFQLIQLLQTIHFMIDFSGEFKVGYVQINVLYESKNLQSSLYNLHNKTVMQILLENTRPYDVGMIRNHIKN